MTNKANIQENEYTFPYHYLAELEHGAPHVTKVLGWGWEYLTYMSFVKEKISELKPKSILDIGCGDGYLINQLIKSCSKATLMGVDTSKKAIGFAKSIYSRSEDSFNAIDIFDIKDKYELVSLIEVIEHIPDNILPSFLKQSFNLSTRYVIITVPTTAFPLQSKHYRHYDEELLSTQITEATGDQFEIVEQHRLYSNSKILNFIKRIFYNKYFTINSIFLKKILWSLHKSNTYFSSRDKGMHICTIYRRIKAQ